MPAAAVLTLALSVGIGPCSGAASPRGVSARTITIGTSQAPPGDSAYAESARAAAAYIAYVDARGGVLGRTIRLLSGDVRRLAASGKVFAIFDRAQDAELSGGLRGEQVPDLFPAGPCRCSGLPLTFGWQPDPIVEAKGLGWYVRHHADGESVAVLYETDPADRAALAGLEAELPRGAILTTQAVTPGSATVAPQVTAIKFAHAQVLVALTSPQTAALAQLTSTTLGYTPQLVLPSTSMPAPPGARGAPPEGAITDAYLPPAADARNPWIAFFRSVHDRYETSVPFDGAAVDGMARAYVLVRALRAAGRHPTQQRLVSTIERFSPSWRGPGVVPLRASAGDHAGFAGAAIAQVRQGAIVLIGPALTSTPAPSSPVLVYTGAPTTPGP